MTDFIGLKNGSTFKRRAVFQNINPKLNVFVISFQDVTLQRKKSQSLSPGNSILLETIIASIPYSVFWKDLDLNFLGCNERCAKDAGLRSPSEIIGKSDYDLPWSKEESDSYREFDRKIIKSGIPIANIEETQKNADGTETTLLTSKVPLKNSNHEVVGILGIYTDITEFRSSQKKIKEQETMLVNAAQLSSLGEMAGGIAHEINNPLSIIKASTKYLTKLISKEKFDPERFKETIDEIDETVDRIAKIIVGLRNISRGSEGEKDLCCYRDILNDVLSVAKQRFKNHGITIHEPQDQDVLEVQFNANRIQISQVLVNLLNNSFDALNEMTMDDKWVEIVIKHDSSFIKLEFTDCGPGIPLKIREKMFNPFFTTKEIGKGTGIGLSISKAMVEKHKGKFFYDETSPHTKFIIQLPLESN